MSDDAIRAAERAYRSSGSPADGEAWVQAVLRTTGLPSTFLIARVIETQRALHSLINDALPDTANAFRRPVTPDDMVSFLRGGREWLEPPSVVNLTTPEDAAALRFVGGVVRPAVTRVTNRAEYCHSCGLTESAELHEHGGSTGRGGFGPARTVCVHCCTLSCTTGREDANAHLPHQRGVPRGDAILCNHANENPGHCPCGPDCYCRQDGHTCSDVTAVHGSSDRECRLCDRDALWYFKTEPRLYVCSLHLAECRVNRQTAANNSLSEMVRHHEAVDDV